MRAETLVQVFSFERMFHLFLFLLCFGSLPLLIAELCFVFLSFCVVFMQDERWVSLKFQPPTNRISGSTLKPDLHLVVSWSRLPSVQL